MKNLKILVLLLSVLLASCGSNATIQSQQTSSKPAPFYITTMTHMEGSWVDDKVEKVFLKHVGMVRYAMDLFDEYNAKLTFESGMPFAKANENWGVNIMKEVLERGHGVGTHADFGIGNENITLEELTADFVEGKSLVDKLVGSENNRGVSAGSSYADWVIAASNAGFEFIDAITALGYLSMDMDKRPEGWTDQYIRRVLYHDPIPVNLADRIYPIPLKDATDFLPDENPVLVNMNGDLGELASLAEDRKNCNPDCVFDEEDIKAYMKMLDEALAIRDPNRVARVNIHIPLILLDPANETLLRELLSEIQKYVDEGKVQWATQVESYEGFVSTL